MSSYGSVPLSPSGMGATHRSGAGAGPRTGRLTFRREESDDSNGNSSIRSQPRPSFLGPTSSWLVSPNSSKANAYRRQNSATPRSQLQLQHHTPFLTMTLYKLEALMTAFCDALSNPSHANAAKACLILDSSVATASSPNGSNRTSPHQSPRSPRPLSPLPAVAAAAVSASPMLQWLSSSQHTVATNSMSTSSSSALALEGEWEAFAAPFMLLAGAENLYADMIHCGAGSNTPQPLIGLYHRVVADLVTVRETLCDPFLDTAPAAAGGTTFSVLSYQETACSLATSLQTLTTMCTVRCQLLELQYSLFSASANGVKGQEPLQLGEMAVAVTLLLTFASNALLAVEPHVKYAAESIHKALIHQVETWKFALEAMSALERCRFLETMVSLRKWKRLLPETCDTRLSQWFQTTFEEVVSLLPIYMDRVRAFSGPLYGFDSAPLFQNELLHHDWDASVAEFLRRQEKAGGPPTAVAIVLDAKSTSNLHVERGFWLSGTNGITEEKKPEPSDTRVLWPAVYMRSTVHSTAAASHRALSVSTASLRSSSGLLRASGGGGPSSRSSLLSNWSSTSERAAPLTKSISTPWHVMEYGPDEGNVINSWPHSEWEALVGALLDNKSSFMGLDTGDMSSNRVASDNTSPARLADEPVAVTYADLEDEEEAKRESLFSVEEQAASLFSTSIEPSPTSSPKVKHEQKQQSTFHVVSLSPFLSMVVIIKGEQESLWHRRRSRLGDEEIRSFLDDIASKLRIARQFTPSRLPAVSFKVGDMETRLKALAEVTDWNGKSVKSFVRQLKDTFGLRPTLLQDGALNSTSLSRSSARSPSRRQPSTPAGRKRRKWRNKPAESALPKSAAALFLGPELAFMVTDND